MSVFSIAFWKCNRSSGLIADSLSNGFAIMFPTRTCTRIDPVAFDNVTFFDSGITTPNFVYYFHQWELIIKLVLLLMAAQHFCF
jgi:hypothetical protein